MLKFFENYKTASVAVSGGADSASVLMLACENLGHENVVAYTCVNSHAFHYETENAVKICKKLGVRQVLFQVEMSPEFYTDAPNRCYYCKLAILKKIIELSNEDVIFDGTNADDNPDNRPGFKALTETHTVSPLRVLGYGKEFTASKAKELEDIEFHEDSCKATRISKELTVEKMHVVEMVEDRLRDRYSAIRYRIDDNRVVFKKPIRLKEDDFEEILKTVHQFKQ